MRSPTTRCMSCAGHGASGMLACATGHVGGGSERAGAACGPDKPATRRGPDVVPRALRLPAGGTLPPASLACLAAQAACTAQVAGRTVSRQDYLPSCSPCLHARAPSAPHLFVPHAAVCSNFCRSPLRRTLSLLLVWCVCVCVCTCTRVYVRTAGTSARSKPDGLACSRGCPRARVSRRGGGDAGTGDRVVGRGGAVDRGVSRRDWSPPLVSSLPLGRHECGRRG